MNDVQTFIAKLQMSQSYKLFEDEAAAAAPVGNVTANIDGYDTPNAFAKDEEDNVKKTKERAEVYGYSMVDKTKKKRNFESKEPVKRGSTVSSYKTAMSILHNIKSDSSVNEVSYKDYKRDQSVPLSNKINGSIKSIDATLREVEKAVGHATRLKTEMSVDQRSLWKSSHTRLVKIAEKLVRISKKLNELGA